MATSAVFYVLLTAAISFAVTLPIIVLIIFICGFCLRRGNGEAAAPAPVAPPACGLSAAAIASLPSLVFRATDLEESAAECVVCISEIAEGEAARKLPQCGHLFHAACIDMWFYSHCTCPLCRSDVTAGEPKLPKFWRR